jgi:hypothetical protein
MDDFYAENRDWEEEELNEINKAMEEIEAMETEMAKAEPAKIFAKIIEAYKDYDTSVESSKDRYYKVFEIKNPYGNDNIKVVDDGEITVYFAYQHAHLAFMASSWEKDNIDVLTEYIDDFISGKKVSVEFFVGDTSVLGGDLPVAEIDMASGESILKIFIDENNLYYKSLKGHNCRFAIRGWDSRLNKDINFVL